MSGYHRLLSNKTNKFIFRKNDAQNKSEKPRQLACPACERIYRRVFKDQKTCMVCVKQAEKIMESIDYVTS